jgi:hypothetical protein
MAGTRSAPGDSKDSDRPRFVADKYYYRRELTSRDLLTAAGAAAGVGAAAFYLATLWLQRTVLDVVTTPREPKVPATTRRDRLR